MVLFVPTMSLEACSRHFLQGSLLLQSLGVKQCKTALASYGCLTWTLSRPISLFRQDSNKFYGMVQSDAEAMRCGKNAKRHKDSRYVDQVLPACNDSPTCSVHVIINRLDWTCCPVLELTSMNLIRKRAVGCHSIIQENSKLAQLTNDAHCEMAFQIVPGFIGCIESTST